MHLSDTTELPAVPARTVPAQKPLNKRIMMWFRRGHLYFGLFLLPWAVLYGITAFLFNHPTAFADVPTISFSRSHLSGTALIESEDPTELAKATVVALNDRFQPENPYELLKSEEAHFNREFAFAQIRQAETQVSILIDPLKLTGTIREQANPEPAVAKTPRPPFAIQGTAQKGGKKGQGRMRDENAPPPPQPLWLSQPFHQRFREAIPILLERFDIESEGDLQITSVPDVVFLMTAEDKVWQVTYNPMLGSVNAIPEGDRTGEPLSIRRFLLRLHTAHGYPGEVNAKWIWAVIVDVMAFVMLFWGLSGLLMWFQIKATRKLGLGILILSAITATAMGLGMHELMRS
jgi:hypothetical protein